MIAAEELGSQPTMSRYLWRHERPLYGPSACSSSLLKWAGRAPGRFRSEATTFHSCGSTAGASPSELQSKNGEIYLKSDPAIPFLLRRLQQNNPGIPITGQGSRIPTRRNHDGHVWCAAVDLEWIPRPRDQYLKIAAARISANRLTQALHLQVYGGIEFGLGMPHRGGLYDPRQESYLQQLSSIQMPTSLDFPHDVFLTELKNHFLRIRQKEG